MTLLQIFACSGLAAMAGIAVDNGKYGVAVIITTIALVTAVSCAGRAIVAAIRKEAR